MLKFNDDELKKVSEAVSRAEKHTSGEITTAVIKESSDYAFFELLFGVIAGAIYFTILVIFSGSIEHWFSSFFWTYNPVYFSIFTGISTFFVIGMFYLIANLESVDRFIIPNSVMDKKVYNRALRHFVESGTCYTKDQTGILIFLSLMERKVVLLADKGINDKIESGTWDGIVKNLIEGIKNNRSIDSIVVAVEECGNILSKEFPIAPDDVNELSDDIQVLKE